jgi:hypothetical protein
MSKVNHKSNKYGISNPVRYGMHGGVQRFHCRSCQRYSRERPPKFSAESRRLPSTYISIMSVFARSPALPAPLLPPSSPGSAKPMTPWWGRRRWRRSMKRHPTSSRWMKSTLSSKKQHRAVIWTAYSRRQRRVIIAYHIGDKGVSSAIALDELTKQAVDGIATIFHRCQFLLSACLRAARHARTA